MEKYQPTPEEIMKAKEMMSFVEKDKGYDREAVSHLKEVTFEEYCKRSVQLAKKMAEIFLAEEKEIIRMTEATTGIRSEIDKVKGFINKLKTEGFNVSDDDELMSKEGGFGDGPGNSFYYYFIKKHSNEPNSYGYWFPRSRGVMSVINEKLSPEELITKQMVNVKGEFKNDIHEYKHSKSKLESVGLNLDNPELFKKQ